MFCNYCGVPNPDDAAFCSACGKPIKNQQVRLAADAKQNDEEFTSPYAGMLDDELLALSKDMASLKPAARDALTAETRKRGIEIEPQNPPAESEAYEKYRGVGGWLVLFILASTVFGPMLTIKNLVAEFEQLGVVFASVVDAVISAVVAGFGIYAGISLLRLKPNAVRVAKRYLIAYAIYMMADLIMIVIVQLTTGRATVEMAVPVLKGSIYVAIWYSYLEQSKRIAITFPHS